MSDKQATKTITEQEIIDESIAQNKQIIEMLMGRLSDANQSILQATINTILGLQQRNIALCRMGESCDVMKVLKELGVLIAISANEDEPSLKPNQDEHKQSSEPQEEPHQQSSVPQEEQQNEGQEQREEDVKSPKNDFDLNLAKTTMLAMLIEIDGGDHVGAEKALDDMCAPDGLLPKELRLERCIRVVKNLYKDTDANPDSIEALVRMVAEHC